MMMMMMIQAISLVDAVIRQRPSAIVRLRVICETRSFRPTNQFAVFIAKYPFALSRFAFRRLPPV